ncbi:MAG: hypothetical protein JWR69_1094 [Pedosphaera sp.]|nr:hypothetical protein [Pedosphaera sp.]
MISLKRLWRPPWRTVMVGAILLIGLPVGYGLWQPGMDIRDGHHDRSSNGIWVAHGWLGADEWFIKNGKTNEFSLYRDPARIRGLAAKLKRHHITDVFPHLCPVEPNGSLPATDSQQVERFLDEFSGCRVMPWIGGPSGSSVRANKPAWRTNFAGHVLELFRDHPRFAGVQLNVEPLTSGDTDFLLLLDELRAAMPPGKILSVAAYPPPTRWQPYPDVHWDESYFREVARRADQMAVMMYDAGQRNPKTYQRLMADWTTEVLAWSEGKAVLLGVPTYEDAGVNYHDPKVENLTNALLGIHSGLTHSALPSNYQGVAIYCDWETDEAEWTYFREHFVKQ